MGLNWIKKISNSQALPPKNIIAGQYLITGGCSIHAKLDSDTPTMEVEAGSLAALTGPNLVQKTVFCDWIMGFIEIPFSQVFVQHGQNIFSDSDRSELSSILGRSHLLYGQTIQEALLYKTKNVTKEDLYYLTDIGYGPSLKEKTNPRNPLVDKNEKPVPIFLLNSREHLEIAQINTLLLKLPIVIIDLSSELLKTAISEGFKFSKILFDSGKTIITILPENQNLKEAEKILGQPFTCSFDFD